MKKGAKKIILFSLILLIFLFSFVSVFSQERKLEIEYPEIFGLKKPATLREYVRYIYFFFVGISGLILFGVLIWAGILYLTSAGQPTKIKEAREKVTGVFLGVILLLSSYLLLYTINPQLVSLPSLTFPPLKEVKFPPLSSLKPEENSLIALELPLTGGIEYGLWKKENREKVTELVKENERFLEKEIKISASQEKIFNSIADLNKYLQTLTNDCQCSNTRALSTFPTNFGMPADSKACVGDPCPKDSRKQIEKILAINQQKHKELLEFQQKNTKVRSYFEKELKIFNDIEEQIQACDQEDKGLLTLNEYLARLAQFERKGWKSVIETVPGAPPGGGDPGTFYCDKSGTLYKYPYPLTKREEIEKFITPKELTELMRPELFYEKIKYERISCPVEFPIGEITDKSRNLASSLIVKLSELANLQGKMASKIEKMRELISQCNEKNCTNNTRCVPNPCYQKCDPYTTPFCVPFCRSPCLQAVGGCYGFCPSSIIEKTQKKVEECNKTKCPLEEMEKYSQEIEGCSDACPRPEIIALVGEMKRIEDEMLAVLKEIKEIPGQATSLIFDKENEKHLKRVKTDMSLCYSPNPKEITWKLLSCVQAIGNYGPTGQIIGECHPRNFFCCLAAPEKKLTFPQQPPPPPRLTYSLPLPEKELPKYTGGCPPGWRCDKDVKIYNQYNDASESLKKLLACMRKRLDNLQKERGISGPPLGRITSISDSRLYTGKCSWELGSIDPPGCSHIYKISYNNKSISCHYGGRYKFRERKSYATDFGAKWGDYSGFVQQVAKECDPRAYVLAHGEGENFHLHVSIGAAYRAGCDEAK